jgi:outer membrane beta-barrel protein
MDRKDFYSHTVVSLGVRYFLSESHAWEMLRVQYDSAGLSNSASDVIAQTGYHLDAKQAPWSISTGYVYSLAYGKYALSENSLIHFDAYLGASLGTRFTPEEVQIFFEPYLGVTHYLNPNLGLVLPEIRTRFYSERRGNGSGSNVLVGELICLAGVTWLF